MNGNYAVIILARPFITQVPQRWPAIARLQGISGSMRTCRHLALDEPGCCCSPRGKSLEVTGTATHPFHVTPGAMPFQVHGAKGAYASSSGSPYDSPSRGDMLFDATHTRHAGGAQVFCPHHSVHRSLHRAAHRRTHLLTSCSSDRVIALQGPSSGTFLRLWLTLQEHSSRFNPASGLGNEPGKLAKELRLVGVQVGCVLGKSGENIGQIRKVPCLMSPGEPHGVCVAGRMRGRL